MDQEKEVSKMHIISLGIWTAKSSNHSSHNHCLRDKIKIIVLKIISNLIDQSKRLEMVYPNRPLY